MDLTPLGRIGLVYAHLLLCVFALQAVLSTDWALLRSRIGAGALLRAHRRIAWLFAGLWASGLLLVAVDTGLDFAVIAERPKLIAKFVSVVVLSANGLLLRLWCFPRLVSTRPLGAAEATLLMSCGALSTTSWLIAAFYGIARGLDGWTLAQHLTLYAAALAVAVPVALSLAERLRRGRTDRLRRHLGKHLAAVTARRSAIDAARQLGAVAP